MCSALNIRPTVGQNHLTQSPFDNQVLDISCNLLNTVLEVKKQIGVGTEGL